MKKLILVGIIVVASVLGIMALRNRLGMGIFTKTTQQGSDLVVVNDSSDSISTEYMENGKEVAQVVQPGDSATGGQGFIRIFTAKKSGSYELEYQFPRPADAMQQVALSQVIEAAKNDKIENELYIKKGMIGDIKVMYEEVEQLDSTY